MTMKRWKIYGLSLLVYGILFGICLGVLYFAANAEARQPYYAAKEVLTEFANSMDGTAVIPYCQRQGRRTVCKGRVRGKYQTCIVSVVVSRSRNVYYVRFRNLRCTS